MAIIPENYIDLLHKPAIAHMATLMADGSPQITPVWFSYDGTHIIVNSARGRVKDKNLKVGSRVAIEISDPADAYRYIQLRGPVAEITEEGADANIDYHAKLYLGADSYPFRREGEVRVMFKITPEKVQAQG